MCLFKKKNKKILIGDLYFKDFKCVRGRTIVTFAESAKTAKQYEDPNEAEKTKQRIARNMKNVVNQTYDEIIKQIEII